MMRRLIFRMRVRRIVRNVERYFLEDLKIIAINTNTKVSCSGCGMELENFGWSHAIYGVRANGMQGGLIPDHDFSWCLSCAKIAFRAVRSACDGE